MGRIIGILVGIVCLLEAAGLSYFSGRELKTQLQMGGVLHLGTFLPDLFAFILGMIGLVGGLLLIFGRPGGYANTRTFQSLQIPLIVLPGLLQYRLTAGPFILIAFEDGAFTGRASTDLDRLSAAWSLSVGAGTNGPLTIGINLLPILILFVLEVFGPAIRRRRLRG